MEPDQRYGYGYLHATAATLQNHQVARNDDVIEEINRSFVKRHDAVVIAHIFYEDLIDSVFDTYLSGTQTKCDLIVTVMLTDSHASLKKIKEKFANCYIIQTSNRGRDIRPFIVALRKANEFGYQLGCKDHTKKSLHLFEGDEWRVKLLSSLIPNVDYVEKVVQRFSNFPTIELLASEIPLHNLAEPALHVNNTQWLNTFLGKLGKDKLIGKYGFDFPAGSMFWFRTAALSQLLTDDFLSLDAFEFEARHLDGTAAHAAERIIGLLPTHNLFNMEVLSDEKQPP